MSARSKFERQLGLREHGFSLKIPDVGNSYKPFDYIVGVPIKICNTNILRFVAIEAKSARGWTVPVSSILPHQIEALDIVESMAPYSSWVAIGFLDIPKMKLDFKRKRIKKRRRQEAFLLWWVDFKEIMSSGSLPYEEIASIENSSLEKRKIGTQYKWIIPQEHYFFVKICEI